MSPSANPKIDPSVNFQEYASWHICSRADCQDFIPPPPILRRQQAVARFEEVTACVACCVCGACVRVTLHVPLVLRYQLQYQVQDQSSDLVDDDEAVDASI